MDPAPRPSRHEPRLPRLGLSLVPLICLTGALYLAIVRYAGLGLTAHLSLVLASAVAAAISWRLGHSWKAIERGLMRGIGLATNAMVILLAIGILIGLWIDAGVVPAMIYYGLELLSPAVFLVAACLVCVVVSLATGSSWSTAATVGIALIGIGEGLGLPRPTVAGAIISGSYFGDKMSPLSDTTNLAPAIAGAGLIEHIRHMTLTTGPSLLISLVVFGLLGGRPEGATTGLSAVLEMRQALAGAYSLTPVLFIAPALVILAIVARVPALPAVCGGGLVGALLAWGFQGRSLGVLLKVAYSGVQSQTGHALVDRLLSRGGLSSMFPTVGLIICALSFGGIMEQGGMLGVLAETVLGLARSDGSLVLATVLTCIGMNIVAAEQYMSIVVPGRMYRSAYEQRGLAAKNLSRALEDSATLTSVLIPWSTCGAYFTTTLGVRPWTYVPYCLLNLINPFISVAYGFTGISMTKRPAAAAAEESAELAG